MHGTLNGEASEATVQSPTKLRISAGAVKRFEVKLKNKTDASTFKVYIKNNEKDDFTEEKSFSFTINQHTKSFETYSVDVSDLDFMQQDIYQIRLMPCVEAKDGYFQIDSLRLLK